MNHIFFIIPPFVAFEDFVAPPSNAKHVQKKDGKSYGNLITDMPLGVLSLSAYLKSKIQNIETDLIDFNVILNAQNSFTNTNFFDFFLEYLRDAKESMPCLPTIVGISTLFSPSYFAMLDLSKACRIIFPDALIIGGGGIPSTMYKEIFRAEGCGFNALCYGEGEIPLLDLVSAANKKELLATHPSWITRTKAESSYEFCHSFIGDLDEIPFYDYELCKDRYFTNPAFTTYGQNQSRDASFHVMTSLGCPFKCIFCASHRVHGRKMRYYSMNRVREDFEKLKNEFGAATLIFQDDHLMGDPQRAYEIIQLVAQMGLKAVFQNSLALYALDRRMLEAIALISSDQLVLSVESGSARVLKEVMRKPLKLSITKEVAKNCRDLGIYTYVNILIGLPRETKADIEETRSFLRTIDANWFGIFCASPLPGSEMFDICEKNGYLKDNHIGSDYKRAVVETNEFSSDYIQKMAYILNLELNFVFNSDMRLGNYQLALSGIERAIKAKPDHAIGMFFAAQCYEHLGNGEKARDLRQSATRIISQNQVWRQYFEMFNLPTQ